MLRVDITRSAYTLVTAGVEATAIVHLMNLHWERPLAPMGGTLEAIPIMEVDPMDFDFEGNLNSES